MKLSIIVVNYNTKDLTLGCIDSIYKFPPSDDFEVIIVDNGSTDGLSETLSKDKRVVLLRNSKNLGFARANNQAIKTSRGEYILLLNSDTKVTKDAIDSMCAFAEKNPDAGAVAAKLLNVDGSTQPSIFHLPTIGKAVKQYWFGAKGLLDKYIPEGSKPVAVEAAVMAAFLVCPSTIKKAGILDERYFMFFEDIDYCRRIGQSGLKIYYLPSVKVYHYHGASGKSLADELNQWRRLIPSSRIYHGVLGHCIFNFILWSSQKWRRLFRFK